MNSMRQHFYFGVTNCENSEVQIAVLSKWNVLRKWKLVHRGYYMAARDKKFLFECWKIFHAWVQQTSEIFFSTREENFVSPSDRVIFYLLYKHQWNAKPFYLKFSRSERCGLLWSHGNGDIFTCEDNMLFSHVKISSFREIWVITWSYALLTVRPHHRLTNVQSQHFLASLGAQENWCCTHIAYQCCDQLTAVKQDIRWPVSPNRIAGAGVLPSSSSIFWSYPLTSYSFSNDRGLKFNSFKFMKYIVFVCHTIKIFISNWPRTRKFSQLLQAGKTVAFDFPHHGHALITLYAAGLSAGHRSGYRSRVRSQAIGQVTSQITGHTQKQQDTGQNCSWLTFYYTKIKQAKEPQLYFFCSELYQIPHMRKYIHVYHARRTCVTA